MNYLDLLLVAVVSFFLYRAWRDGWQRTFLGLIKNVLAFTLAFVIQGKLIVTLGTTRIVAIITEAFEVGIAIPTGPGTTIEGALRWLQETDLPSTLAGAIRDTWLRDQSGDVQAFSQSAAQLLAKATVNLICFVALFIVIRWSLNIVSRGVLRALPPKSMGRHRAMGVTLGIIQSILVCAILVAVLAPLAATALLPAALAEHFRHSKLVGVLRLVLRYLNLYWI